MKDIVLGMAGSGGDGIVSAGELLIQAVARDGYHAMMTKSFGPQIRGGESSCRVRISTERVLCPGGALDVAIALNWDDFLKFGAELAVGSRSVVLYDTNTGVLPGAVPLGDVVPAVVHPLALTELTRAAAGTEKAKNSFVLGLIAGYLGLNRGSLLKAIQRKLGRKGEELLIANEKGFTAGVSYAETHPLGPDLTLERAPASTRGAKLLTDGNDMTAAAAIFAGCQFFGGYPITPSTEVMQFMAREIWKYGGVVLQAEDEIAGVGAAVGASFAGKKAMTATSGPGLDLKGEIMGLASIAELPLVVVDVQRGGPSTGIPTKGEQSDLFAACFSAHGDVVRPVLAPTSVADSFDVTVAAFNLAERYQTPVIILSDQEIAQRKETVDPIDVTKFEIEERRRPTSAELDAGYTRFAITPSGVSPISHPGMAKGAYLGSGIEHAEDGSPTANGVVHAMMNEKRLRKLDPLRRATDLVRIEGDLDAPLALLSWGSSAGVCLEALQQLRARGTPAKLFIPYLVYPVNEELLRRFLASVKRGLVVEQSHLGQFYRLLRMFVDVAPGVRSLCRSGANPFQPGEIVSRLTEVQS